MPKKFAVLHLHIGLEKTGTTSIQAFLSGNRAALARDGVFVPRSAGDENHKLLAAHAFEAGSRDVAVVSAGVGPDPDEVAAFRARVARNLSAEIEAAAASASVAVISSEDYSRLFQPAEVARALDLLRPLAERLHVVAFLRRQDLLASSRYYSLVLGGHKAPGVLPGDPDRLPRYYFFRRNLQPWIDGVGARNVTLARFPEAPGRAGFNSVDRFCRAVGLDAARYRPVEDRHVSLDAVNQITLQVFNRMADRHDPNAVAALVERLRRHNDPACRHIPGKAAAKAFYAHFHDENLRLFRDLGAEDEMFSDDFSMYPDRNMREPYQVRAIERLLVELARGATTPPPDPAPALDGDGAPGGGDRSRSP